MTYENECNKERLLRLPDVKRRTGLSRSTIYAYINAGDFPKGIRIGIRCVAWAESAIDEWIAAHILKSQEIGCASSFIGGGK